MLRLLWEDIKGKVYHLGNLYKENNKYIFDINSFELGQAINHGCFGIGSIDLSKTHHESDELFSFFKGRIPKKEEIYVLELVKYFGIDKYDEMELLKITGGKSIKDRYYMIYL